MNNFTDCEYLFERIGFNMGPITVRTRELFIINFNPTNYDLNNPIDRALIEVNFKGIDLFNISFFASKKYFEQEKAFVIIIWSTKFIFCGHQICPKLPN